MQKSEHIYGKLRDLNVDKGPGKPIVITFKVENSKGENVSVEAASLLVPKAKYERLAREIKEVLTFEPGELHSIITTNDGRVLMRTTPGAIDKEAEIELIFSFDRQNPTPGAELVGLNQACMLLNVKKILGRAELLQLQDQLNSSTDRASGIGSK